ncbi:MAG: YheC/YheD family protein [Bacilli bacterium]
MKRISRRAGKRRRVGLRVKLDVRGARTSVLQEEGGRSRALRYGLRTLPLRDHSLPSVPQGAKSPLVGSAMDEIRFRFRQGAGVEPPSLELDAATCTALHLPEYPVRAVLRHDAIRLGPALAVYATPGAKRLFGSQTGLFADMAVLAREANVDFFVLTPGRLRAGSQKTRAFRFYPSRRAWILEDCPWPDFVWRRTVLRPAGAQAAMSRDEELLQATAVFGTLPRPKSEKWFLHSVLSRAPGVRPFLPAAHPVWSAQDVLHAVRTLDDIYVKPVRGTQGQKITRIVALHPGYQLFGAATRNHGGEVLKDDEALLRRFAARISDHAWIAQRTVELMRTAAGAPIDLRFLVQARPGGQVDCTGSVARVGASDAITTNLHTGAQAFSFAAVEQHLHRWQIPLFRHGARTGRAAALAAFAAVAADHPPLAELGVDVALDRVGRAYILEVNASPGRRMFRLIDPEARRMSLQRVIEYAVFSTGFDLTARREGGA